MDEALVHVDHARRLRFSQAEGLGLLVVVLQHELGHRLAHLGEQLVALLVGQVPVGDHGVQEDLDVHLAVRASNPARVVDRVGAHPPPAERVLDAGALRQAEVPAFAHHAAAQLVGVHAHRVIGLVTRLGVHLQARLDVGADAAVPQQVHRRPQERPDHLGRPHRLRLDPQRLSRLR
jgi:hypothetical protein